MKIKKRVNWNNQQNRTLIFTNNHFLNNERIRLLFEPRTNARAMKNQHSPQVLQKNKSKKKVLQKKNNNGMTFGECKFFHPAPC